MKAIAAGLVLVCGVAHGAEVEVRLKGFGDVAVLPEEDVQRQAVGNPAYDQNLDVRLMVSGRQGDFSWLVHDSTTLVQGDGLAVGGFGITLDQTAIGDARRLFDLTWTIDEGDRHLLVNRLDRLAVSYRHGPWSVTAGRQAVSWGNGIVFQPLDLFNPFSPTTVDQDYKAGDDLLLVERSLASGGSLALLAVGRKGAADDRTGDTASVAGKLHLFAGRAEIELVAGRHFRDYVAGTGVRFPVGGALLRNDLLATRLDTGTWKLSGIVNIDYSLLLGGRNLYLFGEYFHSAFGVSRLPPDVSGYPQPLIARLERGELFNLMRDYLAAGGTYEWHPLWTQTTTLIGNLDDGSVLLQAEISHEPDDHQHLDFGVVAPLGSAGDEFGGVPVAGDRLTVGGGTRVYLRWVYYL